jgi:hypothetical protein
MGYLHHQQEYHTEVCSFLGYLYSSLCRLSQQNLLKEDASMAKRRLAIVQ